MDEKTAREKYRQQRYSAARRGIEWRLTFEEWLAWWDEDLDRRGVGAFDLQMQRVADAGPYALDNIRKGIPRRNMKTMGVMRRKRESERRGDLLEAARNGAIPTEAPDVWATEDDQWLHENVGWGSHQPTIWD